MRLWHLVLAFADELSIRAHIAVVHECARQIRPSVVIAIAGLHHNNAIQSAASHARLAAPLSATVQLQTHIGRRMPPVWLLFRRSRLQTPQAVHVHNWLLLEHEHRLPNTERTETAQPNRKSRHLALHRRLIRFRRSSRPIHRPLSARHHQLDGHRHLYSHLRRPILLEQLGLALHRPSLPMRDNCGQLLA